MKIAGSRQLENRRGTLAQTHGNLQAHLASGFDLDEAIRVATILKREAQGVITCLKAQRRRAEQKTTEEVQG